MKNPFLVSWCILLLFMTFCLLIVAMGSNGYKKMSIAMEDNFHERTPMQYIATKIRQSDRIDSIEIKQKDGESVLILKETVEGKSYATWIYAYKGYLQEAFVDESVNLELSTGMTLLPLRSLEVVKVKENLLGIKIETSKGKEETLLIPIKSR